MFVNPISQNHLTECFRAAYLKLVQIAPAVLTMYTILNRNYNSYQKILLLMVDPRHQALVLLKKKKRALIAFLLFLPTRLEPGELSTRPLLRWAVARESRLSDRLLFRLRNRRDGIWRGPSWAGGGWYSRTPALFLLQVTPAVAGGSPLPVPKGSLYPLDELQLKKGWSQRLNTSPHQLALKGMEKMNWGK